MEGDRRGGCRTLPIQYGVQRAAWMISPSFVVPFLMIPAGAWAGVLTGNFWLLQVLGAGMTAYGIYVCYLMLRRPEELAVEVDALGPAQGLHLGGGERPVPVRPLLPGQLALDLFRILHRVPQLLVDELLEFLQRGAVYLVVSDVDLALPAGELHRGDLLLESPVVNGGDRFLGKVGRAVVKSGCGLDAGFVNRKGCPKSI